MFLLNELLDDDHKSKIDPDRVKPKKTNFKSKFKKKN